MKLVFCVVIFAFVAATQAQDEKGEFPDYWQDDYDNFYDYPIDGVIDSLEKTEDTDKQVEAEIQDFRKQNEVEVKPDKQFDGFVDYQIEDNRSDEKKDKAQESPADSPDVIVEPMPDDAPEKNPPKSIVRNKILENDDDKDEEDAFWNDFGTGLKKISTFLTSIEPQEYEDEVQPEKKQENEDKPDKSLEQANIFENSDEKFMDEYDSFSYEDEEKTFDDLFPEKKEDEFTPEKTFPDLSSDLDKLLETLDKLSEDNPDSPKDKNAVNNDGVDDIKDYEDKYGRPYKEGNILNLRDDYDNFDDSNLTDVFAENASVESKDKDAGDLSYVNDDDNNQTTTEAEDDNIKLVSTTENATETDVSVYLDELNKRLDLDDSEGNNQRIDELVSKIWSLSYGEDGLVDETQPKNEDAEVINTTELVQDSTTMQEENISTTQVEETTTITNDEPTAIPDTTLTPEESDTEKAAIEEQTSTIKVENLSSAEYNNLMNKFVAEHSEYLDVNSEKLASDVSPIHITLSVDKPTVITSPNYPAVYPVNTVIDWVFEGPGRGIEMNVTELQMNGGANDYLLVKPGGVDASGTDGLIFSWTLTGEKKYRFTNVNRMFVRFRSHQGWPIFRGFSLSAKLLFPPIELEVDGPETEEVIAAPKDTVTLSLAGLTLPKFLKVQPTFKEIIADMAQEYILDNEIEEGLNTTSEVTQITRLAVCNIRWPEYESCVDVTFGVPLQYEGEAEPRLNVTDLEDMWKNYITKEQYAVRLRELGITEYAIPDDSSVLMVWLVIAAGVVISMGMLAFALWRFSCFEDYTRMRAFKDADSIQNEKKNLDLYPTPHQTLPPLYADADYKWADEKYDDAARVDMGGFANKSYVRDDLFEFDTDEDITARDRHGVIKSKDSYEV